MTLRREAGSTHIFSVCFYYDTPDLFLGYVVVFFFMAFLGFWGLRSKRMYMQYVRTIRLRKGGMHDVQQSMPCPLLGEAVNLDFLL
jgi:hypothetical protein